MEPYKIAEEDLQDVAGGLNKDQKIAIGVGSGVGGLSVTGGAGALIARKMRVPAGGRKMSVAEVNAVGEEFRGSLSRMRASIPRS